MLSDAIDHVTDDAFSDALLVHLAITELVGVSIHFESFQVAL